MSKLPKLKLKKPYGYPFEEIRDFEQAKDVLFSQGGEDIVVAEGQVIKSYEELVQLATQDSYEDKEFLEVWLLAVEIGGG